MNDCWWPVSKVKVNGMWVWSAVSYVYAFTRVSMCVWRCVSHAVSNQRLSALDDVSLDTPVVIPPLPESEDNHIVLRHELKMHHDDHTNFIHSQRYSSKRKTSKCHHISLWRLKVGKNHQHWVSPRISEDSLHASIIRVSILHVISAPPCGPQLFFIICTHKHNNHVVIIISRNN